MIKLRSMTLFPRLNEGSKVVHILMVTILALLGASAQTTGGPLSAANRDLYATDASDFKPVVTITKRVDEVDLFFTASDRHHKPVANLSPADISLQDNSAPPAMIARFDARVDLPLRVGMVIDLSNSITKRFDFEKDSASFFVGHVLNPTRDVGFVMPFNSKVWIAQDFSDGGRLSNAIQALEAGGATALYDAVYLACKKLEAREDATLVRRVLVVISDGKDTTSAIGVKEAIAAALHADALIMALNTDGRRAAPGPEYDSFKRLAEATGGQMLLADDRAKIARAFQQIEAMLRSQYMIAYKPANLAFDGSFHKIRLKTKRHGIQLFYRKGYFSPRLEGERE